MLVSTSYLNRRIGDAAMMHLLVDGLCMCCLYLTVNSSTVTDYVGVFLSYNLLAFASQPVTGLLVDYVKQKHWMLITSVATLALAVLFASLTVTAVLPKIGPWMVPVLLGFANSMFHVWGGKHTVLIAGNDMRAIGVFVSTGALGLSLGFVFCSWKLVYAFLIMLVIVAADFLYTDNKYDEMGQAYTNEKAITVNYGVLTAALAMVIVMALVMFRSYFGEVLSAAIRRTNMVVLGIGVTAMLGKMAGGWLAKGIGVVAALSLAATAAAVCWLLRENGPVMIFVSIFIVNLTMPITLYLANVVMRGKEGFAFGLLAAALIPGYLIAKGIL